MIAEDEIANVLGQRMTELHPPLFVGWPNKDVPIDTPHPFLLFEIVPVGRRAVTLNRSLRISRGFVMVTVMTQINTFATEGLRIAESVAELFPYTLRIATINGEISITQEPEIMQGRPDDPHYRTPVRIPYEAS